MAQWIRRRSTEPEIPSSSLGLDTPFGGCAGTLANCEFGMLLCPFVSSTAMQLAACLAAGCMRGLDTPCGVAIRSRHRAAFSSRAAVFE